MAAWLAVSTAARDAEGPTPLQRPRKPDSRMTCRGLGGEVLRIRFGVGERMGVANSDGGGSAGVGASGRNSGGDNDDNDFYYGDEIVRVVIVHKTKTVAAEMIAMTIRRDRNAEVHKRIQPRDGQPNTTVNKQAIKLSSQQADPPASKQRDRLPLARYGRPTEISRSAVDLTLALPAAQQPFNSRQ